MTTEIRPAHSPLGASAAERWMNCPGSVALLKELELPHTDEADYRRDGTAAHGALEKCLKTGVDAWELAGEKFHDTEATVEILDAVQVFLDHARPLIAEGAKTYIEFGISSPLHPLFYGTVDFAIVHENRLVVRDYKHGAGIIVEVEENPQIMYYAYGILRLHPDVETVSLGIVQPRGFHPDGPIRTWEVSAEYIRNWAEMVLLPAMHRTEFDDTLDAGPWCRFCPAKLVCPMLTALFEAACNANPKHIINLSDESIGHSYQYIPPVKSYLKALEEETLRRLMANHTIGGVKLVNKKANRVFKPGAVDALAVLGEDIYTKPEIKSPSQLEELGERAKKLVREWAYTPQTGYTVALETDKRPAVKVQSTAEAFPNAAAIASAQPEE